MDGFVGRERELATLREALARARNGTGSLVLVSGEAGIGKSSLLQVFLREARERDPVVLIGYCYDLSATRPYGPWLDLLESCSAYEFLRDPPQFIPDAGGEVSFDNQSFIFSRVLEFIRQVSETCALVIVLEDLHWSDFSSLELLRFVARRIGDKPVMLVITYRDDELHGDHDLYRLLPTLVRESQSQRLELRPLINAEIDALLRDRYGSLGSRHDDVRAYLQEFAEGNPLFVDESLRNLEWQGILVPGEASWTVRNLSDVPIPSLLRQIVDARISRLTPAAQQILEIAAVAGHTISLELLEQLAATELVLDYAEEALHAGILIESGAPGYVSFRHALFRDVAYTRLSLVRRRAVHRDVASALIEARQPDLAEIAHHLQRAGDPRAFEWLVLAGERAEHACAWAEAVQHYEAALTSGATCPNPTATEVSVLLRLCRALRSLDPERGLQKSRETYGAALAIGDRVAAASAQLNIGVLLCHFNNVRTGLDVLREVARTLTPEDEQGQNDLVSNTYQSLALWASATGHYREAIEATERLHGVRWYARSRTQHDSADELLRRSGSHTHSAIAFAFAHLGSPDEAQSAIDAGFELSRQEKLVVDGLENIFVELAAIHFPYKTHELERRAHLTRVTSELFPYDEEPVPSTATWTKLWLYFHNGDWSRLRTIFEALNWRDPHSPLRDVFAHLPARVYWYQGEQVCAQEIISAVLPEGPNTEPGSACHAYSLPLMRLGAEIELESSNFSAARAWMSAHDRWLAWNGAVLGRSDGRLGWAMILLAEGDHRAAESEAFEARTLAETPEQPISLIAADRLLGTICLQQADLDRAHAYLAQSLRLSERCSLPFERARTLLTQAECAMLQGATEQSVAYATAASNTFESLGATPSVDAAAQLVQSHRNTSSAGRAGLSPRELDVLRLLSEGLPNKAIADRLFISHHTVMRHVSSILQKLDVESRTAAVTVALRREIL